MRAPPAPRPSSPRTAAKRPEGQPPTSKAPDLLDAHAQSAQAPCHQPALLSRQPRISAPPNDTFTRLDLATLRPPATHPAPRTAQQEPLRPPCSPHQRSAAAAPAGTHPRRQ
ncbi:unnamed protein product [Gadus morhua 'NCC']